MNRPILHATAIGALLLAVPACGASEEDTETASNELNQPSDRSSTDVTDGFRNPAVPLDGDPTQPSGQASLVPPQSQAYTNE